MNKAEIKMQKVFATNTTENLKYCEFQLLGHFGYLKNMHVCYLLLYLRGLEKAPQIPGESAATPAFSFLAS